MRIALGQINTTVGDFSGNARKIVDYTRQAAAQGAELIVFPELSLTGYPPRDLVEKSSFVQTCESMLEKLARDLEDTSIPVICGTLAQADNAEGKHLHNSAVVLHGGKVQFRQDKMLLPTYDVFDEGRYFAPAEKQSITFIGDRKVAISICEDAWNDQHYWARPLYERDPIAELAAQGADLIVSVNASPYHQGKRSQRHEIFSKIARRHNLPLVYVNQVGGNDQLVFDGSSFAMDATGKLLSTGCSFGEDLLIVDLEKGTGPQRQNYSDEHEAIYQALVLGTHDYIRKCGFGKVLIGLSGGIDSALVAAVAVDAVGAENVIGVGMPGPYSTDHSLTDARELAANLKIRFEVSQIRDAYEVFLKTLNPLFAGLSPDVTEENLQSRLRGVTLMALSNKFGALVLTTGNKSELAVGYATLYGDMCGGLAVISDVPKTLVYPLCRVANNRHANAIPENIFVKPPSAELRPDQKDTDSLPEYDILDKILEDYIEDVLPPHVIAERNQLPIDLVRNIVTKVNRNEYKRQQAAPGLRVTSKAFGIGRRYPIAQGFTE